MSTLSRFAAVAALAAATLPAFAATTTFTSSAAFLATLQPGAYTETFSVANPAFPAPTSIPYSSGGFSFTVAATGGVYTSGSLIGTNAPASALTITFGAGTTAVGGNFFLTDIFDDFVAAPVTLTLSDGTTTTYTPTSEATYRGFTSDVAITSLTFAAPAANYASLDNLTVGRVVPVPEASTWAMMALGLVGMAAFARKRQG